MLEIRPGPLSNKGGELMLHAAVEQLGSWHDLATEHWIGPYAKRARLGLYQKVWFRRLGPLAGATGDILPKRVRRMYGLVNESEINGVIDAAGFAYSDQFGPEKAERMAAATRRWRRQGKTVVLLPQAFGPFSNPRVAEAMGAIAAHADLLFARDESSRQHLVSIGVLDVDVVPDVTIGMLSGSKAPPPTDVAYVVPNEKMVTHTEPTTANAYRNFLVEVINQLQRRAIPTEILLHEPEADRQLADDVQREVGGLPLVVEHDALELRRIIGSASLVVGSRYHALVSALSQGVPTIAAGWSHKYESLLRDFGCADFVVAPTINPDELESMLERVTDPDANQVLREMIVLRAEAMRARIAKMWASVHAMLGEAVPADSAR